MTDAASTTSAGRQIGERGLRVELESRATVEQVNAVQEVLDSHAISVRATGGYVAGGRGGLGDIALLIFLIVSGRTLMTFLNSMATEAGKDAYHWLRDITRDLCSRPTRHGCEVRLRDEQADVELWLDDDVPDEAFKALLELDVDSLHDRIVYFDLGRSRWKVVDLEGFERPL